MIDIAMLTCNRARLTKIVIEELEWRTLTDHRLIVVDNGSDDDTPDMLIDLKDRGLIDELALLPDNTGVHWGHNTLLEMVKSDLYVSADNDLVPQSPVHGMDWLAMLVDLAGMHAEYAAVACRPHVMIGDNVNKMFADAPPIKERPHVGAHLRLMRTEAVRKVGGWQHRKRPSRNHEEKWICGRLRKAGWKVGYARDVRVIHLFGQDDLGEDYWGYTAGTHHEGHRDVWPPPNRFNWERLGVDWETCR